MTEKQIELVESSWEYILLNTNDAGAIFYDRLFSIEPSLKPLFKENIKVQSQKLISMITFVVHKLSNLQDVVKDVIALVDKTSSARSKLVHAENISVAPQWTQIPDGVTYNFLLIFSALPKACKLFDLIEDIPQAGGFFVPNISRNDTDVYHIDI